ncbi:squalene--hopene cyclase [Thermopetrobacter sp. TC1]|uniref:squalene--hopene cyclase n=1 Tax=Thermopetrobacter sp. TC1 TaxID=1495045 RepID=UPI000571D622|nr:squalene--hopene cyclase [Thermopetrobacter sp. TC1]
MTSEPAFRRAHSMAEDAARHLLARQHEDGHFVYELEADATIPAEYIFLNHFIGDPEPEIEAELGEYLRAIQSEETGGWPLFHEGPFDVSASVKAYYALKILGDDVNAPHMVRARKAILAHGGAEKSNVFTRYLLALFGQIPWHGTPAMPAELMLMPKWFPVNIWKMSYWSRTVIAPLLVIAAHRPLAANPTGAHCQELFCTPPSVRTQWQTNPTGSAWGEFFLWLDKLLHPLEKHVLPHLPFRRRALERAMTFCRERANGLDGLGAIFPAMANYVMAMHVLGVPPEHPDYSTARESVRRLLTPPKEERGGRPRYCQPCVSPVWDTALATHALLEAGVPADDPRIRAACDWLAERQITEVKGDWAINAPDLAPGGWAFQYRNDYYPDVDDTAVVGMLLHRVDAQRYADHIDRARRWIIGMQSSNGGWGAFDIDNNAEFLNSIPFADHGALLDPPTEDVTARCLSFLAQTGMPRDHEVIRNGIAFLRAMQMEDGSWFGRWGTNYIYGTWSVLCALNACGEDMSQPWIRKAVDWLKARQQPDGGWGEDGRSYWPEHRDDPPRASTPSQTAWAMLALMAAGEVDDPALERAVAYLEAVPRENERWQEELFTAVGFPRVFYLRYHGYAAYFPIWALARYARLKTANEKRVPWGM